MFFPEFPNSREIILSDKPVFDKVFAERIPELSGYTFTNIYAWRESYGLQVSSVGDDLIIIHHDDADGNKFIWEPLGTGDIKSAVVDIIKKSVLNVSFTHISSETASLFKDCVDVVVEADPNNADYVYFADDLINLSGRKLDGKRNFISRFKSEHDFQYEKITSANVRECMCFARRWCDERSCRTEEGLMREYMAVNQMLSNYDALHISGGAIRVDGKIVAFSLGEAISPDTLVVHVEKGDTKFYGIYQLINNEFCIHEASGFKYVNREQDLGIPGLRKAKKSYQPAKMVESYKIKREN